jgi:hypothetical protein
MKTSMSVCAYVCVVHGRWMTDKTAIKCVSLFRSPDLSMEPQFRGHLCVSYRSSRRQLHAPSRYHLAHFEQNQEDSAVISCLPYELLRNDFCFPRKNVYINFCCFTQSRVVSNLLERLKRDFP